MFSRINNILVLDMKQEDLFKALIKELFETNTTHYEYQDGDSHYVVDSAKEGNKLTFTVQILENEDKKKFEKWLENIDDELFSEVLDELKEEESLVDIEAAYNSPEYKEVIKKVQAKTFEIAKRKMNLLKKVFSLV